MKLKLLCMAALATLALVPLAGAQSFTPLGYCQLTPAVGAVGSLLGCAGAWNAARGSIPPGANAVILRAEGATVRFRDDRLAPSASVGIPILPGDPPYVYEGSLTDLQFAASAAGAIVDVEFVKIAAPAPL